MMNSAELELEHEEDKRLERNYLIRKYGRISIILSALLLVFLIFTGNTPGISLSTVSFGSNGSKKDVAIQGSKHVNPPIHSEYWTSNKFDF